MLLASATSVSTTTSTTTTTPPAIAASQLVAACIAAANAEPALEWRGTMRGGGSDITEVAHAGRVDGTQTITGYRGGARLSLNLVLIGQNAYVLANAGALQDLVGLKPGAAAGEAGKWLVVPASDQQLFSNLAAGLTVSSATQQLDIVGALELLPKTTLAGTAVLGVETATVATGTPGTQDVYMRADGKPLPVEAVQDFPGEVQSITFVSWGAPPVAKAPPGAVHFKRSWQS